MLCDPGICQFLGPSLFPAAHAGLIGGIRFRPLPRSRLSGFVFETDTQPPLCLLDRVARVRRRLSTAWFSTVCRMAVASLKIARSGNFPYATLRGGCLCYSSMLAGYASEVAVVQWIGRRATGNNEHVRYTVPFLIGVVFTFCVAPSPRMERAALGRPEDKLNRLLPG